MHARSTRKGHWCSNWCCVSTPGMKLALMYTKTVHRSRPVVTKRILATGCTLDRPTPHHTLGARDEIIT